MMKIESNNIKSKNNIQSLTRMRNTANNLIDKTKSIIYNILLHKKSPLCHRLILYK